MAVLQFRGLNHCVLFYRQKTADQTPRSLRESLSSWEKGYLKELLMLPGNKCVTSSKNREKKQSQTITSQFNTLKVLKLKTVDKKNNFIVGSQQVQSCRI